MVSVLRKNWFVAVEDFVLDRPLSVTFTLRIWLAEQAAASRHAADVSAAAK